jgi:hypothetical protein
MVMVDLLMIAGDKINRYYFTTVTARRETNKKASLEDNTKDALFEGAVSVKYYFNGCKP